jgi:hypothetical protein
MYVYHIFFKNLVPFVCFLSLFRSKVPKIQRFK